MQKINTLISNIKLKFNLKDTLSFSALLISLITMYFQFFHEKHELLYASLSPSIGEKLVLPIIFKNTGNQNEVILECNIELEIIPDDGSENYFKRIGDENKKLFPLIIAPGEYKAITLHGDYHDYFNGMLEYTSSGLKYREIVNLANISLVLTTRFISNNEISEVRRNIGKITFKQDRTFDRIDFEPIKLVSLKSDSKQEMIEGSVINLHHSMKIALSDSLTSDEIEQVKFLINVVEDTLMKHKLEEFLKK